MKYIQRSWKNFEALVVPKTASATQRSEMRKAFFAGAAIIFEVVTRVGLSEGAEPQQSDLDMLEAVNAELKEFGHELDLEVFGLGRTPRGKA